MKEGFARSAAEASETAAAERKEAVDLPAAPEMTAEQKRALRESIGREATNKYLEARADDGAFLLKLKQDLSGKDLRKSLDVLLGANSVREADAVLAELGISQDRSGNWRLRNPDPDIRGSLPGSFAKEEHLKAFLAGFAEAGTLKDKVQVIFEVYRYLGLPMPEVEELLPPEEPAEKPAEGKREPIPLSKWKSVFAQLGKYSRNISFAVGLVTMFSSLGLEQRPGTEGVPAAEAAIEHVDTTPRPSTESREVRETTYHVMKKGETVEGIVREMLGDNASDEALVKEMTKKVLEANGVKDKWYGTTGDVDSTKMDIGTIIDVTVVVKKNGEIRMIDMARQDLNNAK